MSRKKILVVSCTKGDGKGCNLLESLAGLEDDVSLILSTNNSAGLPEVYNRQLKPDNLIKHDIVLFVHDDVYIDDARLKGKLYTAIEKMKFDIVGLAGSTETRIKKPALWHQMSNQSSWTGAVGHPVGDPKDGMIQTTTFGPWPKRCLILDGLFLAVNLRTVLEKQWKFNTNYQFHHYDIAACLDANNKKLKLGTYPIYATHSSPGLRNYNDKTFQQSQTKFLNEYGNH